MRDSQILYIYSNDVSIMFGGRANGKTLSQQLRLILRYKDAPINFNSTSNPILFTDFLTSSANSQHKYLIWYKHELRCLYEKCKLANIKLREIIW